MISKPLLHLQTESALTGFAGKSHAVVLIGPFGSGKSHVAVWLARRLLEDDNPTAQKFYELKPQKGHIGIDEIRGIQHFLRLKSTGRGQIRRIVVINNAELMTKEAQNALLKILEEPPEDVCMILTTVGEHSLLPTVYSRMQKIRILPVSLEAMNSYFNEKYDKDKIKKAHALSGGYAGLSTAILNDEAGELVSAIERAKELVGRGTYGRLLAVNSLSKDRDTAEITLYALKRVLSAGLEQSSLKNNRSQTLRLIKSVKAVHEAEEALQGTPNLKLTLTNAMINL